MGQRGFTLVELFITVVIIATLAGIAIVVFKQYTVRAYNTQALTQIVQLETAHQAATADNSTLASTLFAVNREFMYQLDTDLTCTSGCGGIDLDALFPGFQALRGVRLIFGTSTDATHTVTAGHCKSMTDPSNYDGWVLASGGAPIRTSIAAGIEVDSCALAIGGADI